jgi:hypothetical protein
MHPASVVDAQSMHMLCMPLRWPVLSCETGGAGCPLAVTAITARGAAARHAAAPVRWVPEVNLSISFVFPSGLWHFSGSLFLWCFILGFGTSQDKYLAILFISQGAEAL